MNEKESVKGLIEYIAFTINDINTNEYHKKCRENLMNEADNDAKERAIRHFGLFQDFCESLYNDLHDGTKEDIDALCLEKFGVLPDWDDQECSKNLAMIVDGYPGFLSFRELVNSLA